MRKHTLIKIAFAAIVAGASLPAMAQSGSSGSSGTSGSAGLGIDFAGLSTASGTGNPYISLPGSSNPGRMGGPIEGLREHFTKTKPSQRSSF
ncbi:hypothetical protein [Solimonas variicoloris]|uniref:hypothetical protein n=1 Tax=Solimonas variicoloris TaxID=254408 RepID=UPI000360EC35|nr:hypothetical protein [Solimonas variicoloris]